MSRPYRTAAPGEWSRKILSALMVAVPVALAAACGSDGDGGGSGGCTPGVTAECFCSGQRSGVQVCSDDGASFGSCDCEPAGSSGSGGTTSAGGSSGGSNVSGASGSGGTPTEAEFDGATGLPCSVDSDCFAGMNCIPSTVSETLFGLGGPQNGYCTSDCTESSDCLAIDRLSDCSTAFDGGATGQCLAICPIGVTSPLGPACAGRNDMACANLFAEGSTAGLCLPTCWSDEDCGARVCDLGSGLCVDALVGRGPGEIGAACTLDTQEADCASATCFPTEDGGSGFCTGFCTLASGGPVGCGFGPDAPVLEAACAPTSAGSVGGDQGLCFELCDVDADCSQPGLFTCEALGQQSQDFLGRTGQCVPNSVATPAPGVDAGSAAGDGG